MNIENMEFEADSCGASEEAKVSAKVVVGVISAVSDVVVAVVKSHSPKMPA